MKTSKPREQRKRLYQAPLHIRYKQFSAPLSPELKRAHNTNAVPVRTGDTVRLMRGDRKGFEGKVSRVDRKKYRIFVEGINREKVDGTSVPVPIHPSKVIVTRFNLDDKWRRKMLERRGAGKKLDLPKERSVEEREPKPVSKPVEKELGKKSRKRKKAKKSGGG
jgi:large subunit ribosomal protein L24